jgi:hypothetical protein
VDFIKQKWGWDKVFALAADYSQFEKILGMSKDEFNNEFIAYLKQNYGECQRASPVAD